MSDNLWQKIEDIFPLVVDLPTGEREAYLNTVCGEELLQQCRRLHATVQGRCRACTASPDTYVERMNRRRVLTWLGLGGLAAFAGSGAIVARARAANPYYQGPISDRFLEALERGARAAGLPEAYVAGLRTTAK